MKIGVEDLEIEVRAGTVDDVPLLLSFIRAMADFEELEVTATEKDLRESLFGDRPAAYTLLAFADGKPVAYAVYFYTFATMVGKRGLWLDDLYVNSSLPSSFIGMWAQRYSMIGASAASTRSICPVLLSGTERNSR
jgi:hypothetical protein